MQVDVQVKETNVSSAGLAGPRSAPAHASTPLTTMPTGRPSKRVIIVHNLPLWDERGGDCQVYTTILALLELKYEVTFIYPFNYVTSPNSIDLTKLGVRVVAGTSIHQMLLLIEDHNFDAVIEFLWFNPDYMAYLRALNTIVKDTSPNTRIVVINPDIIHIRLYEEVSAKNPRCMECLDWKETELYFWSLAEVVAGINENLNKVVRGLVPSARVVLLPYCQLEIPTRRNYSFSERSGVVFFGSQNPSNALSFRWLQEDLVPRLHKLHKANLLVYGRVFKKRRGPHNGLATFGPATVAELNEGIMRARWMLAPVFSNVGVSTKVVRSLALGTPVVTTVAGTGGMESIYEPLPMVITDKQNFTDSVVKLYEDEALWADLHSKSKSFISKYFGLGNLIKFVKNLMDAVYTTKRTLCNPPVFKRRKLSVAWELSNAGGDMNEISKVFQYLDNILSHNISSCPSSGSFDVYVRIKPFDNLVRPSCCKHGTCKFIVYFPWEHGYLPIRWTRLIEENVDFVWTLSRYYASMFKNSGLNESIIRVVPFGIDCTSLNVKSLNIRKNLKIPANVKILGYIGRNLATFIIPEIVQVYLELLEKQAIYHNGKKDVLLMVVTPPDYRDEIPQSIRDHPKIKFVPHSKYDIRDIYRAFDFLLHPLGSEWSMAPVEILSQSKVVLTGFKGVMADYLTDTDFSQLLLYSQHWPCKKYPCIGRKLCLDHAGNSTNCEELVYAPVLLGVPRRKLKNRMERVLTHPHLDQKGSALNAKRFVCESYNWRQIAKIFSYELFRSHSEVTCSTSTWNSEAILPNMLQYGLNTEAYGAPDIPDIKEN